MRLSYHLSDVIFTLENKQNNRKDKYLFENKTESSLQYFI
jgi:hypothetical protein